jgi:hypothetical protein
VKIILHMGQSKTGTTSLQKSLRAVDAMLRERKVLYPPFAPPSEAQHLLMALCGLPNKVPPWQLDKVGGVEDAVTIAQQHWNRTVQAVQHLRPELLVLSSELIAHQSARAHKLVLGEYLARLSRDITPVLYVRHPVERYRSRLQQWLKSRDRPLPPNGDRLRQAIADSEAAFGRSPELVTFDRKLMHGGDVVVDFATRFLSSHVSPSELPSLTTNVGLSAEATFLLARLRKAANGTLGAEQTYVKYIRHLEHLDKVDPPAKPFTLLPEVAEAVLRSAVDYRWLVETGRLEIPGLDISRIDGAGPPDWMLKAPPETMFLHDPERLERLWATLQARKPKGGLRGEQVKPAPSLQSRITQFVLRKLGPYSNFGS